VRTSWRWGDVRPHFLGIRGIRSWGWTRIEFLWAADFWSEVLTVIKLLCDEPTVSECALMLFCWLPYRMINLERALVKDRLLNEFGILMNESDAALWLDKFEMSGFTCEEVATCVDLEKLMFFRQNDPGARE